MATGWKSGKNLHPLKLHPLFEHPQASVPGYASSLLPVTLSAIL